ncbi:MAG: M14 family zinc carboxypeptidase [Myxococcales bacterium]|nr:M14 family zinc carboxypeptidase [Myxococcales bacterium]MDH5566790.1 M14 family zinc carboxypeptidase [Myxococcales bacterium]
MRRSGASCAALAGFVAFAGAAADDPYAPDVAEPGSVEAIAAATTAPEFSSPWVAYVPESPDVPSPADVLGHIAGAPGELSRSKDVYAYFRALAGASPRVHVETIGTSEEGRDILLAVIADETVLRDLPRYREATAQLADPRRCDGRCMEDTLGWARPIYYLNGGLHSTETGSPEMLMELAYRLAVSEQPLIRAIRERVIVLINPVSEPDGRDRAVDWYYRFLKGKTDYDDLPEVSPPFWGRYVFHDNNRDAHQRALALTRAIHDTFFRWHPQVVHDLHESIPFLLVWTGTGPYNVNMDPILVGEWHEMAFNEVRALSSLGMPGVWTWGFGEGWGHMFVDSVAVNHNAIGRGYETFGITSADTMDVRLDLAAEEYVELPVTRRTWYRPWPPQRTFRWSLRNNTNYMQTGVLSILHYAALHAEDLLRDFWRKGQRAVELGSSTPPYAFAIAEEQADRGRLAALVNLLRGQGLEVSRTRAAFDVGERSLPAGSFLVRLDQPYRGFAMDLLEAQRYPADEAAYQPYDDVSWALPYHFGVDVVRVDDPSVRQLPTDPVTQAVSYAGRVTGEGPVFLLRDTGQEALLAARQRLAKLEVEVAEQAFEHGGRDYPPGSWLVRGRRGVRGALEAVAAELGLDFDSANAPPDVPRHALDLPRLAVLHTWHDTQGTGWVRMLFDQTDIRYELINDDDIKRGQLERRFDVILYPHTYDSLEQVIQGIDPKHGPMPYTRTDAFPSHGTPDASPDITGGLTLRGLANLKEFVERGGVLVTLGGASGVAFEAGFARGVRRASTEELHTPGVEIRARFRRPDHPVAYGYPEVTSVFRQDLTLYETREADLGWVVLQWGLEPLRYDDEKSLDDGPWGAVDARAPGTPDTAAAAASAAEGEAGPPLVLSGGMQGESELEGRPAILDIPIGRGHIVAFGFDPIHRSLARSDFRLVWNALLNWNDLPAPATNPPVLRGASAAAGR